MDKETILDLVGTTAKEAQIRDDVCSRSTLIGLQAYFKWIPDDMIRASLSLCGGAGAASGSCGTYTCGLLAIGLKYNVPLQEELRDPQKQSVGAAKFIEFRDRYLKEMGTTLCPEIQKQIYGRAFIFTNPDDRAAYACVEEHRIKCGEIVERATRLIAEMLLEEEGGNV